MRTSANAALPSKVGSRTDLAILVFYAMAFSVGTFTHLSDLLSKGFLPYTQLALFINIFWTSLVVLDPLVVLLLLLRRVRAGVWLATVIMAINIWVSLGATLTLLPTVGPGAWVGMLVQGSFATFLFVTAPRFLKKVAQGPDPGVPQR